MLEHEWPAWLPPEVLFPVGRLRMPGVDRDAYAAMAAAAPEVARDLAAAGASVVAYACALGSVYDGPEAEGTLAAALAAAAGRPAVTLGAACVAALRRVGARRPAILTPYGEAANRRVTDYATACGLTPEGPIATPVDMATVGDLSPAAVVAIAVEAIAACPHADSLWIPCTALQTLDAIEAIEAVAGRPVVSGSQALLWRSLEILELETRGPGCLFR
jgi:maleate cis-trans isomerase